jgi:septum formation protein
MLESRPSLVFRGTRTRAFPAHSAMNRESAPPLLTLASASPRRRELIALGGWSFTLAPTSVEERPAPGEGAEAMAVRLALAKARATESVPGAFALGADTVVEHAGEILGKPGDASEAQAMLERLAGESHRVVTALAILGPDGAPPTLETCITQVPMRDYTSEDAAAYVAGGSPLDKAGGYGIQDDGFQPVDVARLHGCFANVMGLPLCHLARAMRRLGHPAPADVPAACRAHTGYDCPVHESILRETA